MFLRASLAFALLLFACATARAQVAFSHTLPLPPAPDSDSASTSAWIDLRQSLAATSKTQSAPDWVSSVSVVPAAAKTDDEVGTPAHTVFRIRLLRPNDESRVLLFRLFFDDKTGLQPELVAWDESGTQIVRSGLLGAGIGLPGSDTVKIPMIGVSCIDIEVPGDGTTVRSAFLDWLAPREVMQATTAEKTVVVPEPFAAALPLTAPEQDNEVFGTVTAVLAAEPIKIGPTLAEGAGFQFPLEAQPLVALLTFEIANASIENPPEVYVNREGLGAVTLILPDLADPAYRGTVKPLVRDMTFHYTGWLRAQKLVPAASLKTGANDVIVVGGPGSAAASIRATQVQLKYIWDKSDYLLQPDR